MDAAKEKTSLMLKNVYGMGQMTEGLFTATFALFALFYYNQLLGVPGSLVGLALGIAFFVDAVTDPIVGSLSDHWRSRLGRRHPFIYVSILPIGISLYLLFSPPDLSTFQLFLWLLVTAITVRISLTLFMVPHLALGAELTNDFTERTQLVQSRQLYQFVGLLAGEALAFLVFFRGPKGQLDAAAYPPLALTVAIMIMVAITISAFGTQKATLRLVRPIVTQTHKSLGSFFMDVARAFKERNFRLMAIGTIASYLTIGTDLALSFYVNSFYWALGTTHFFYLLIALPLGCVVGTLFTSMLHNWFDKRPVLIWGMVWWLAFQIIPIALRELGMFPENGDPNLTYTLLAIRFVQGIGLTQAVVSAGSMLADIADQNELDTGNRQEGVFFGVFSFCAKSASALGGVFAGIGLDIIKWPVATGESPIAPTGEQIFQLGMFYGPIVGSFTIIALVCYAQYTLTREEHAGILKALRERRET